MTNLEEYPVISALTPNEWAREAHIAPSRPIRFKGSSLCGEGGGVRFVTARLGEKGEKS